MRESGGETTSFRADGELPTFHRKFPHPASRLSHLASQWEEEAGLEPAEER